MAEIIHLYSDRLPLPSTKEEADAKVLEVRTSFANDIVDLIVDQIIDTIERAGFPITSKSDKDIINLQDVIRSMLYRTIDVHHDIQDTNDERYSDDDVEKYKNEVSEYEYQEIS